MVIRGMGEFWDEETDKIVSPSFSKGVYYKKKEFGLLESKILFFQSRPLYRKEKLDGQKSKREVTKVYPLAVNLSNASSPLTLSYTACFYRCSFFGIGINCSRWEQILFFQTRPFSEKGAAWHQTNQMSLISLNLSYVLFLPFFLFGIRSKLFPLLTPFRHKYANNLDSCGRKCFPRN